MTFQIRSIVLYSLDGKKRVLKIRPGRVTVFPGASKSGKSALISIVDYCLGSRAYEVPPGIIKRSVSWMGLVLCIDGGEAFVARRCPPKDGKSTEEYYYALGATVEVPEFADLHQLTNLEGMKGMLDGWCGVKDNRRDPTPTETRLPVTANMRHALPFCFQPQDLISRRSQLFFGTNDHWVARDMKAALPYFLGAVREDYVRKAEELRTLKASLKRKERELKELESIRGEGSERATALLSQARDLGLLAGEVPETWDGTIAALRKVQAVPVSASDTPGAPETEFSRLTGARQALLSRQRDVKERLSEARVIAEEGRVYSREADEQVSRLKAIGVFGSSPASTTCPLCTQELASAGAQPTLEQLRATLGAMSGKRDAIAGVSPRVDTAIAALMKELADVQEALLVNRRQLQTIQEEDNRVAAMRDEATRRAHVLGRISLFMETIPERPDTKLLEDTIASLNARCTALEEELSDEQVRERMMSISALLGQEMTKIAKDLNLEHSENIRPDFVNLTLVADTRKDGAVPLTQMGSGENWLGYHVLAHLVLHKWFVEEERPVPRFLFLDQPSQVYFPKEREPSASAIALPDPDREAITRLFDVIFKAVADLKGKFQVIITEHAELREPWYEEAVDRTEAWWGDKKLIPEEWDPERDQGSA